MTESALTTALRSFSPVSLADMERVSLMNRSDTKFLFSIGSMPELLSRLRNDYRILEIGGGRLFHYSGMYFDTPERLLYMQHHNGRMNRCKIRSRRYVESDRTFFEVKLKINGRRTRKERIPYAGNLCEITDEAGGLVRRLTGLDARGLEPVLQVEYARLTLVHPERCERITMDVSLQFRSQSRTLALGGVAIAEIKQEKLSRGSEFFRLMQSSHIYPVSISKYCTGTALLCADIKHNRFKPKLRTLHKVTYGTV